MWIYKEMWLLPETWENFHNMLYRARNSGSISTSNQCGICSKIYSCSRNGRVHEGNYDRRIIPFPERIRLIRAVSDSCVRHLYQEDLQSPPITHTTASADGQLPKTLDNTASQRKRAPLLVACRLWTLCLPHRLGTVTFSSGRISTPAPAATKFGVGRRKMIVIAWGTGRLTDRISATSSRRQVCNSRLRHLRWRAPAAAARTQHVVIRTDGTSDADTFIQNGWHGKDNETARAAIRTLPAYRQLVTVFDATRGRARARRDTDMTSSWDGSVSTAPGQGAVYKLSKTAACRTDGRALA